ncbi:hypothetical protein K491DRAFT_291383 [Lophiostoma macrostomum CBS 122681]|uniref:Uncharacterized protein n=1 Tax=Lophiostoma macrostomum CBS 122681 TaxID=1314788 RepID=A0A6A6SL77_9PLEO|nr:hypothetical protein K491DRAFT_291383 [Lophiostoma macrostomum CBS 122681]
MTGIEKICLLVSQTLRSSDFSRVISIMQKPEDIWGDGSRGKVRSTPWATRQRADLSPLERRNRLFLDMESQIDRPQGWYITISIEIISADRIQLNTPDSSHRCATSQIGEGCVQMTKQKTIPAYQVLLEMVWQPVSSPRPPCNVTRMQLKGGSLSPCFLLWKTVRRLIPRLSSGCAEGTRLLSFLKMTGPNSSGGALLWKVCGR